MVVTISSLAFSQAIKALKLKYPWVCHNDPSHAMAGDVAKSCVCVAWQPRRGICFDHMAYFDS